MSWNAYTETMQQLAAIRRRHDATQQHRGESVAHAQVQVDQLTQHLETQRGQLFTLATLLRLPRPYLDGITPSTAPDLRQAINAGAAAGDTAHTEMQKAQHLGTLPRLWPTMSPTGRAAAVYAGWTLAAALGQCTLALFSGSDVTAWLWSLCGLPALAFFAGFATLHILGQPRIGGQVPYSLRLGGVICFLGGPVLWAFTLLALNTIRSMF